MWMPVRETLAAEIDDIVRERDASALRHRLQLLHRPVLDERINRVVDDLVVACHRLSAEDQFLKRHSQVGSLPLARASQESLKDISQSASVYDELNAVP